MKKTQRKKKNVDDELHVNVCVLNKRFNQNLNANGNKIFIFLSFCCCLFFLSMSSKKKTKGRRNKYKYIYTETQNIITNKTHDMKNEVLIKCKFKRSTTKRATGYCYQTFNKCQELKGCYERN